MRGGDNMRYQIAEGSSNGRFVMWEGEFDDADEVEAYLRQEFTPEAQEYLDLDGDDEHMYVSLNVHLCCEYCPVQRSYLCPEGLSACPGEHPTIPDVCESDGEDCENWEPFYFEATLVD